VDVLVAATVVVVSAAVVDVGFAWSAEQAATQRTRARARERTSRDATGRRRPFDDE